MWFVGTYDFDGSTDISDECTEWGESAHERILTGNVRVKYGGRRPRAVVGQYERARRTSLRQSVKPRTGATELIFAFRAETLGTLVPLIRGWRKSAPYGTHLAGLGLG